VDTAGQRDDVAVARLLTYFRARDGRWRTPTGEAWQPALAIEAIVNTYQRTGDGRFRDVVARSFQRYRGRRSDFNDDDGWYLNAWLRAFEVTGDRAYLDEAVALFEAMARGWDETCGGGVWWRKDRTYKNAVTNELFLLAAARLHRWADPTNIYRDWAERAWAWFDASGMINAADLVNDGLDGGCANNGQTTWTYNQGVVLAALSELRGLTGDDAHLARAGRIADSAIASLTYPDGVLREPGEEVGSSGDAQVFKGIFAHGLAALYRASGDPAHAAFLRANADAAWSRGRDRDGGVGLVWAGPPGRVTAATQASACLLLGNVALLDQGRAG
jgi:predicted alpha-1,6-mannanase (GH76 family)